jgi:hypothetical protein
MRTRTRAVLALTLIAAAVPAVAIAGSSGVILWHNKANTVTCGLMSHSSSGASTEVLCSAKGIPAPKHTTSADGDPGFVQIGSTGSPKTLRLSQNSFAGSHTKTLANGTQWTAQPQINVTCSTASNGTVLCFNGSNHGFRIGDGHYHSF